MNFETMKLHVPKDIFEVSIYRGLCHKLVATLNLLLRGKFTWDKKW